MAGDTDIAIRIRLLEAARARAEALRVASGLKQIGIDANFTSAAARRMGMAVDGASRLAGRGLSRLAGLAKYGAIGIGGLGVATAKWGLQFNAQVESARIRFRLFTDDVDGLTRSIQQIDLKSQFSFGDLSDAAAMLGNAGVDDVAGTLQGIANAAAASGNGSDALMGISRAIGQIGNKSRLSMEEVNQLSDQMAPGVWDAIRKRLGVTKDEMQNLGNEGINGKKAIRALVAEWTSGRLAKAAEDQTKTLGGQWALLTGNLQKASGAMTLGLAGGLAHDVLPAANKAASAITKIFGQKGLSNTEKLRRARTVIERELGPVWDDLKQELDEADIPEHLGDLVGKGAAAMANAAADAAPHVAQAFLDAWLHSSAGVQIASLLYLGKKGKDVANWWGKGANTGKRVASGLGGVQKVYVVNKGWGDMPGGDGPNRSPRGGGLKNVLKKVAPVAGPVAAYATLAELSKVQGTIGPGIGPDGPDSVAEMRALKLRGSIPTGPNYYPDVARPGRHDPPLVSNITLKVNGAVLARATVRAQNQAAARRSGGKLTSRGPQGLPG